MFAEQLAKMILVPYLWLGGYDEESMNVFYFSFVSATH